MRKSFLIFAIITSASMTSSFAIVSASSLIANSFIKANEDVTWYHFAAVEPTATTHGSKEFWTSTADNCGTHYLTNPGELTYVERDFSTHDYFETLSREDDRYIQCLNEQWGITPVISGQTITYGLYPQTHVNDASLIAELDKLVTPESNGWYLYNNVYYAKVSASQSHLNYSFDDGLTIVNGETYWFKCESISWNILNNIDGEYFLLSSFLLDAHRYAASSNNYKNSEIRTWLNIEFSNSAFALHSNYIKTSDIDNSALTTDSASNTYVCENTKEKVFLPSYRDYVNASFGFDFSNGLTKTRECKTTDWARVRGSWYPANTDYEYNGYYWTRSPYSGDSGCACCVDADGVIFNVGYVDYNSFSVRPAITLKIS